MNKNFKSKLVAGLMTTAMIFSSAAAFAPVHAVDTTLPHVGDSTSVSGPILEKGFTKFLKVKDGTTVPNVSFNFTISKGEPQSAGKDDKGNLTQEIKAGILPDSQADQKAMVGTATFTSSNTTNNSGSDAEAKQFQLSAGEAFAEAPVKLDFSKVTYRSAGIYRYIITEDNPENDSFTAAGDVKSKALDVYVIKNTNTNNLEVQSLVLHKDPTRKVLKQNTDTKEAGFLNEYNSHDLTFKKLTTGNQINPQDTFEFTLTLKNALKSTTFKVDTTHAGNQDVKLITDGNGDGSVTVNLAKDQYVTVKGLNDGVDYTVKEKVDSNNLTSNGYSLVSATFTAGDDNTDSNGQTITLNNGAIHDDSMKGNVNLDFTNDKGGTIPTGIIFAVAPFAVGAVVLAAFIIVKMRRTAKQ